MASCGRQRSGPIECCRLPACQFRSIVASTKLEFVTIRSEPGTTSSSAPSRQRRLRAAEHAHQGQRIALPLILETVIEDHMRFRST
jgi:hypothetical protein